MVRLFNVHYPKRAILLLLGEALLVALCFVLATLFVVRSDTYLALVFENGDLKISAITILTVVLSYYFDLYEAQFLSSAQEIYFRLLLVIGCSCFVVSAAIMVFPQAAIADGVYALGFALLAPTLILWRKFYERLMRTEYFRERVYVLGNGAQARTIVEAINANKNAGMEIVGWHELELEKSQRKQKWIADLERFANGNRPIRRVVVAVEDARNELPVEELLMMRFQGILVETAGTVSERLCGKIQLEGLRPSGMLYAEGFRIRPSQQLARQVLSRGAAAVALLILSPILPLVCLAIRLSSPGPIFFRQTRVGLGGRPFQVVKFRTMVTDAESAGAQWAVKNDPRVTKLGMFLRKTRIDEVPQLWNVLRGEMAFVGPRPERPEFIPWLTEEIPYFHLRHLIRPGLTGWAQIRYGYGATLDDTREKLEYDLYYIKNMSLGLDLLIMFETIKTIVRRRGAQ
jgi:sugar transferase (PEP-CTERM system associated)